jgi:hypothetical protein
MSEDTGAAFYIGVQSTSHNFVYIQLTVRHFAVLFSIQVRLVSYHDSVICKTV